jgi:hypothetical protein
MEREGAARDATAQSIPDQERRAAPRLPSSLKIACYPAGGSFAERRQGRIRNVSRTGIGIVVDRAWQSGVTLILELPAEEGEGAKAVRARVIHATPQMSGMFLVGCNFENALTDAEVQALSQ